MGTALGIHHYVKTKSFKIAFLRGFNNFFLFGVSYYMIKLVPYHGEYRYLSGFNMGQDYIYRKNEEIKQTMIQNYEIEDADSKTDEEIYKEIELKE